MMKQPEKDAREIEGKKLEKKNRDAADAKSLGRLYLSSRYSQLNICAKMAV